MRYIKCMRLYLLPLITFTLLCTEPYLLNIGPPPPSLPVVILTTAYALSGVLFHLLLLSLSCRGDTATRADIHYELPNRFPSQSHDEHPYRSAASHYPVAPEPPQPRDTEDCDTIDEYLTPIEAGQP